MADGYLENRYAEYEKRKAEWLKKQAHKPNAAKDRKDPWRDL